MNTDLNNSFRSAPVNLTTSGDSIALIVPHYIKPSLESIIMKAFLKNVPIFLVTLSLIFLVSCASGPKKEGAGEYVDDTVITTRVKAEILKEDTLKVAEINVETFKGVVQLSGFVNSVADQQTAVRLARGVPGVTSVKNDMRSK
ncbi:MAG TPA: BON domain-containing protein [Cellvibrio sp.]|nr:BON domain-containing protein [Cellvibrio sp.]